MRPARRAFIQRGWTTDRPVSSPLRHILGTGLSGGDSVRVDQTTEESRVREWPLIPTVLLFILFFLLLIDLAMFLNFVLPVSVEEYQEDTPQVQPTTIYHV